MILIWSKEAESDLENIILFIARDDVDAAIRMDNLLRSKARKLVKFPFMGHKGRISGTREWLAHKNYRLIYKVNGEIIEIVTLVHAAMNYPPAD